MEYLYCSQECKYVRMYIQNMYVVVDNYSWTTYIHTEHASFKANRVDTLPGSLYYTYDMYTHALQSLTDKQPHFGL